MEWSIESGMPGIVWPAIVPPPGAAKLALLYQLEQTQWLSSQRLRELQLRQVDLVLRHAISTVAHYRERFGKEASARDLADLPLLGMRELQENFAELKSQAIPREHGGVGEARTSGSTGAPKRVLKTQLSQLFWHALTLREHLWHRRDLSLARPGRPRRRDRPAQLRHAAHPLRHRRLR